MKHTRGILFWFVALLQCAIAAGPLKGQEPATPSASRDEQEEEECTRHLHWIFDAIQEYRRRNHDLPKSLSDLVPSYLGDSATLICPIAKRTGVTQTSGRSDSNIATSYDYEFRPDKIPSWIEPGSVHSMREWKQRQMGLLGGVVPIVRCHYHSRILNLAFDGTVYTSGLDWESKFLNVVDKVDLTPSHLFSQNESDLAAAYLASLTNRYKSLIPDRDPKADPSLIDLSAFYNAALSQDWQSLGEEKGNDLSEIKPGIRESSGVLFDVRGIIQLGCSDDGNLKTPYPRQVTGIPVHAKCGQLHVLHATGWGGGNKGDVIGFYVAHLQDGKEWKIPIRIGMELLDWWFDPVKDPRPSNATVAWSVSNRATRGEHRGVRIYHATFTNPFPDIAIETLDFVSAMTPAAPFLIAVTVK